MGSPARLAPPGTADPDIPRADHPDRLGPASTPPVAACPPPGVQPLRSGRSLRHRQSGRGPPLPPTGRFQAPPPAAAQRPPQVAPNAGSPARPRSRTCSGDFVPAPGRSPPDVAVPGGLRPSRGHTFRRRWPSLRRTGLPGIAPRECPDHPRRPGRGARSRSARGSRESAVSECGSSVSRHSEPPSGRAN